MSAGTALRTLAVGIVLLAILDPSVTSMRRSDAVIAVVASDAVTDSALAERVASRLEDRFSVVRGPFPGAAATVVAGEGLPGSASWLATPVFTVVPTPEPPELRPVRIDAPARAPLRSGAPVTADLRVVGGAGRTVEVVLRSGALVLDRREMPVQSDDERLRAELSATPLREGPLALRVEASVGDRDRTVARDLVVEVVDRRWSVLVFDPRPSWMSTFVRRALEHDPRFEVTSRVVTSPGLATDFGTPPPGLGGPAALAGYDAVVVGAPEGLTVADAAGLERFLRRDGGSVVLLLDRLAAGAHEGLIGVESWSSTDTGDALVLGESPSDAQDDPDAPPLPRLRATEVAWPTPLPPGARVHVAGPSGGAPGAAEEPASVIWSIPAGPGRLVVSGALDAWRFRDPETSGFEDFWRELLAEAAERRGPPLEARLVGNDGVARPGSRLELEVTLPDADPGPVVQGGAGAPAVPSAPAGAEVSATVRAALIAPEDPPGSTSAPLSLWPDARTGRFRGSIVVPEVPGVHWIVVEAGDARVELPLFVDPAAARPGPDEGRLVAAWIGSRGGAVVSTDDLQSLPAELAAALGPERRRERWHPMRSAWWIVPFALALGGEWWWRRRQGLA